MASGPVGERARTLGSPGLDSISGAGRDQQRYPELLSPGVIACYCHLVLDCMLIAYRSDAASHDHILCSMGMFGKH